MLKNYFKKVVVMFISFVMLITVFPDVSFTVNAAYENTHVNTGNQREDIVAVAETQIGYHEGSNNDTKYNRWNGTINGYPVGGYGYPWCQCFVSWCANQAGISTDIIPRTAGTSTGMSFFKNRGLWNNSSAYGGSYTPRRGDIVYFSSSHNVNSPSHVGIVSGYSNGKVNTIEGNCSDQVKRMSYSVSDNYIIGYCIPNYKGSQPIVAPKVSTNKSSYVPGANIDINWTSVSNATGYWIDIYRDGEHIITSNLGNVNSYTLKNAVKAKYGVFVTAYRDDGNWQAACSECYNFQVKDLNAPTVYTKAKYYVPDAEVDIKWNLVNGATGYWIDIYREGEHILSQSLNNANTSSYTYKCSKGTYEVFVTAYSENGGWNATCSNCYNFYVRDISAPTPTTNNSYYTPKSNVEINWNKIDDATGYWIDIWKDGKHTFSQNIGNVTSYTISNTKIGTYEVYITAFNENGGWSSANGEAVKFYVKERPSKPSLNVQTDGSSIILNWNECSNTDFYGVRINNFEDGSSYLYKEPYEGNDFTTTLPPGKYFANIASVQKNGFYTFSDDIYFEIEDSKIETCK